MTVEEARALFAKMAKSKGKRGHKYGAKPTRVDGHYFASQLEAKRYGQLKLLERAKAIFNLRLQTRFPLVVNGVQVGVYVDDFDYVEPSGAMVVEDAKGVELSVYKLKRALFAQCYPNIIFREVRRR